MNNKAHIRKTIQQKRGSLLKEEVNLKSRKIANNVIFKIFKYIENLEEKNIALYLSANNEVDTTPIINYLLLEIKNNNIALPYIDLENNIMNFKKYFPNEELVENKKYQNILEPDPQNPEINPEIIFVPLVACDKKGNRIGMGGGFYDKKIADLKKNNQNITLIGLSYDFQIIDEIQPKKHDQTLDFIAYNENIIRC